jgi:Flp pilus assembly protein TadG
MKIDRSESGQVLVLVTLSLFVLIGFIALAVDIGYLYNVRRRMQTAADAAAIAGSNALQGSNSSNYQQAARDVASFNGFTNGTNNVTVTVGAPASPPNPSSGSYVEVDIAQAVPTYFLGVVGYSTMNVSAHAVSGTINSPACVYALDPSAAAAIGISGIATINTACGIIDDSDSSTALSASGIDTITASAIGVTGNYTSSGLVTFTPTPKTGIAPASDPLGSLAEPSAGSYTLVSTNQSGSKQVSGNNNTVNLTPGVYPSGITLTGNSQSVNFAAGTYGNGITIDGNAGSVTFNPGQYQNTGSAASITIMGNSQVTFNSGSYTFVGAVSISGNNNVTFSPGLYEGGIQITGNATVTFNSGTYILAGGGLSITGNSTISGTGVTFYNTSGATAAGSIDLTGNETANLSAPTSGSLAGILFFQDRSVSSSSTIEGNSSSTFDGVLYFPNAAVNYVGNSSVSGYTTLIADTISISGNSTLGDNYSSLANGSPIKSTTLYE